MNIAVLKGNPQLRRGEEEDLHILVFNVIENNIVSIKNESLGQKDFNYLSLWLLSKKIGRLYMSEFNEEIKKILGRLNISLRSKKEIENNPALHFLTTG